MTARNQTAALLVVYGATGPVLLPRLSLCPGRAWPPEEQEAVGGPHPRMGVKAWQPVRPLLPGLPGSPYKFRTPGRCCDFAGCLGHRPA